MIKLQTSIVAVGCLVLVSCASPLEQTLEKDLRQRLLSAHQNHVQLNASKTIAVSRPISSVEEKLTDSRRIELDYVSGPTAYKEDHPDYGPDLLGQDHTPTVSMSLQKVVHSTLANNLTLKIARLVPAVDDTLITQAQAVFDATFFANVDWQKIDAAQPPVASATGSALSPNNSETTTINVGIRKPLTTGGQVTLQQNITRIERSATFFTLNNYHTSSLLLNVQQPLLRNFGTAVNRAQIELAVNARRENVQDLRQQLIDACQNAETAYWNLSFSRQRLLIQQRLLQRTMKDRDQIEKRAVLDASPAVITEANSFVEARRAEVIRAQNAVRSASDSLKRLMNDKEFSVSDETMIVPLDDPIDAPLQFSLLDAITTALKNRPSLRRALMEIDDAAIRQQVADNQQLPLLNLSASMRFNGVGPRADDAVNIQGESKLIDYLISAQFEMPLGNRAAKALYRQRQVERSASVVNYQNTAQLVVLEVKDALRAIITAYRVIGAERASRRAAAENLRALEAQEEAGAALTPEFLDLKLRRQEALAQTEIRELQAIVDYNIAIGSLYQAMGTLLDRNGIEFKDDLADRR